MLKNKKLSMNDPLKQARRGRNQDFLVQQFSNSTNQIEAQIEQIYPTNTVNSHLEGTLGQPRNKREMSTGERYFEGNQLSSIKQIEPMSRFGGSIFPLLLKERKVESGNRDKLYQPKKVTIVRNTSIDINTGNSREKSRKASLSSGERRRGSGSQVRDKVPAVDNPNAYPRSIVSIRAGHRRERTGTNKRVSFSPNISTGYDGSSQVPIEEYSHTNDPRSGSRSKSGSRSNRRSINIYETPGKQVYEKNNFPVGFRYSKSSQHNRYAQAAYSSAKQTSAMSKNSQILNKFINQEKELHRLQKRADGKRSIDRVYKYRPQGSFRTDQTQSTKALLEKIKNLSGQRRQKMPQSVSKLLGKENRKQIINIGKLKQHTPLKLEQSDNYQFDGLLSDNQMMSDPNKPKFSSKKVSSYADSIKVKAKDSQNMFSPGMRMSPESRDYKDLDYIPGREREKSLKKKKDEFAENADGEERRSVERLQDYAQSKRELYEGGTGQKDQMMDALSLQNEKIQLIQALNKRLVELDGINQDKRRLNNELIETIRAVREMQLELGTADNSNVQDVADKEIETQLRLEQRKCQELKEQVQKCQAEQDQLVQQLKFYSNEKDITILTKQGGQLEFQKVSMKVRDIIVHYENVQRELEICTNELENLSTDPRVLEDQISQLRVDVDAIAKERMDLSEQLGVIQQRFDIMYAENRSQIMQIHYDLRYQNRYRLALIMQNTLGAVLKSHMQDYFSDLARRQGNETNQIRSILAFRKICYGFEERRLKKYIQRWFQKALKPMDEKHHSMMATYFQTKDSKLRQLLIKWDQQRLISQFRTSRQLQQIKNFHHDFDNFYMRQKRYSFDLWKGHTDVRKSATLRLKKFFLDRNQIRLQQAIFVWKQTVMDQDTLIQMHAHAFRISLLQYKQSVFNSWRMHIQDVKVLKFNLKLRAFRALQKNKSFSNQRKQEAVLLLKIQQDKDCHLLQICFRALNLNKEQEKYTWAYDRLNNQELLQSMDASKIIERARRRAQMMQSKRALKKGVIEPFTKVLKSYFNHWHQVNRDYRIRLNTKLKDKIIKMYRSKLLDAWARWQQQGQQKRKKKRRMLNQEMQGGIMTKEAQIADLNQRIKAEEVRAGNTKNSKFRDLLLKAYKSELRFRLKQWKAILEENGQKAQAVDKSILRRMRLKILKANFIRYRNQIQKQKSTQLKVYRAEDVYAKFKFMEARRIYNAWHAMMVNNQKARKKFKKILEQHNKKYLRHHYVLWQNSLENKKQKRLKKRQIMMTQSVQSTADSVGQAEDFKFQKEQRVVQQVRSGRQLGHKTVKKYIARFRDAMYRDAFARWKCQMEFYKLVKSGVGQTLFVRMGYRRQQDAFARWRKNIYDHMQKQKVEMTILEKKLEGKQRERLRASETNIAQIRETSTRNLQEIEEMQRILKIKKMKIVDKLIKDCFRSYSVPKQHQIFYVWRSIAARKAMYLRKLVRNLQNNQLQKGLDTIFEFGYGLNKLNKTQRKLYKFYRGYEKTRVRLAFTLWKEFLFKTARQTFAAFDEAEFHETSNSDLNRDKILKKRVQLLWSGTEQTLTKFAFQELRKYAKRRKFQRGQFLKAEEGLLQHRLKYGLIRWKLSAHEQRLLRVKEQRAADLINRLTMIRALRGLKEECLKHFKLQQQLKQVFAIGSQELMKYAFGEVRNFAENRGDRAFTEKQLGAQKMIMLMKMGDKRNLKLWFDQFLYKGKKKYIKELKIKTVFRQVVTRNLRQSFLRWTKQTRLLAVVQDLNESGPVRYEERNISADVENLKRMLLENKVCTKDELKKLLSRDNRRYRKVVEKTLCRMLVHGDAVQGENVEWIKPWCLDKWKQLVKERKSYRFWLNHMNTLLESRKTATQKQAFDRWKRGQIKDREFLEKQTPQYLMEISNKNAKELLRQANQIEQAQKDADDLKNQRDYLIDKVVAGQRLALARCNFSFRFAKTKAWNKWRESMANGQRDDFDDALGRALAAIKAAKAKIEAFEDENGDISEQNEGLREGAMEGMESLREVGKLQQEVADLNQKLTQQALQMKQLLLKNKQLQKQVREAEAKVPQPRRQ